MNQNHFAVVPQSLTSLPSRRDVLRGLASAGLGLSLVRLPGIAEAKKKHGHKKHKPKVKQKAAEPNAFGCIDVGDPCQSADQCCSGICDGKEGKKTCRAHDVGDCQAGAEPEACDDAAIACATSAGAPGVCGTTTGNAGYCWVAGTCSFCTTDVDCQLALGGALGPRAACIQCAEECTETGGTACVTRDV